MAHRAPCSVERMSMSPEGKINVWDRAPLLGCFRHKQTDAFFEYSAGSKMNPGDLFYAAGLGHFSEFPHKIFMSDGTFRYATVAKTVAYVCVDEDCDGNLVIEKWQIKQHKEYK